MATASNPQTPVVEISGLTKTYGEHRAVDDLSFCVQRGEIFGVLGNNGAGKTTTVECAQGIRRADAGTVRVLGCDPIADRHRLRGRVGSQLQDSNLPERLKVREALRLFADDRTQSQKAMANWELTDLADKAFGDLSGGQRQRLFLALALLNDPEVVFLDELTQGLDPAARRTVWDLIERVRDQGTTVVLVTHFMEEAEVLCDRVVVVRDGLAIDRGTPAELIERHSTGIRVRFEAPGPGGGRDCDLGWIQELAGVTSASIAGTEIEVTGASPMLAYLGAGLVARNEVPSSLRVHQPTLEDALLNLINPTGVSS